MNHRDEAQTGCELTHRDIKNWARTNAECCVSCGTLIIDSSELYKPLTFNGQIRLLQLYPGLSDSKLVCELFYFRFLDYVLPLSYEAISYTWSDRDGVCDRSRNLYFVDHNRPLRISKNCHSVLRRVRHETETRIIWIDAVCIDQKNLVERAEQVKLMPKIYSSAEKVMVYLGALKNEEVPHFRALFDYIEIHKDIPIALEYWWSLFLSRRWFRRIWVLQEVLVANRAIFLLGPLSIERGRLLAVRRFSSQWTTSSHPIVPLFLLWMMNFRALTMIEVLYLASWCDATDPRDKVYGLLGLLPEKFSRHIEPDYTKSVMEVYKDATVACINEIQDPKLLEFFDISGCYTPSWIIDFSVPLHSLKPIGLILESIVSQRRRHISVPKIFKLSGYEELIMTGLHRDTIILTQDVREFKKHKFFQPFKEIEDKWHEQFYQNRLADEMADLVLSITKSVTKNFSALGAMQHCQWRPSANTSSANTSLLFTDWPEGWLEDGLTVIDLLAPCIENEERVDRHAGFEIRKKQISTYCPQFAFDLRRNFSRFGDGSRGMFYVGSKSIGVCPVTTQVGDLVYKLNGVDSLTILRKSGHEFKIVGHCAMATTAADCRSICLRYIVGSCECLQCELHQLSAIWLKDSEDQYEYLQIV